jgi:phage tail protein X
MEVNTWYATSGTRMTRRYYGVTKGITEFVYHHTSDLIPVLTIGP